MTREEKKLKKIARADRRGAKNRERNKLQGTCGDPIEARRGQNCWPDSNSPTGYSQRCSYEAYGDCQFPCNGDC